MAELSIAAVFTHVTVDACVLKFWLLLLGGVVAFFGWIVLVSRYAQVWGPSPSFEAATTFTTLINMTNSSHYKIANPASLFYGDIWCALALMAAIDASTIVMNFNRSLIHQFHYFISLRMTSLAFIISAPFLLLHSDGHNSSSLVYHPLAIFMVCCIVYILAIFVTNKLHKLLPVRGVGASRGCLEKFSKQLCLFDLPWVHNILFAAINGAVGLALATINPSEWSMMNPLMLITWEVTFLGLMGTKQTPRYIWFATPIVQAFVFTDWGLRQVVAAPRLVMAPGVFLSVMLTGRLMLDLHLRTMFCHRLDFQWARKVVLIPTTTLIESCAGMLLLEYLGIPVASFIKPIAVVSLHTFGVLVFLIPASYAIAFDKIETIRN
ncbi:uncharacterized protein N7484_008241 [Penicillium longicatenatum]|uniref:uncharacterized protein n=1 Tax=Penicillium longicatenatum TaxID=1561947 RepID=UPI002546FAA6|nr:uncharacterized protein N7484_008241 [Penicillium longicatenatum]KAJ5634928.1 hypothetical protein N7484_008241 [Penicillium longicatenatum]